MSYIGGGPYEATRCPLCGEVMWNGVCENRDCEYHWKPFDENDTHSGDEEE